MILSFITGKPNPAKRGDVVPALTEADPSFDIPLAYGSMAAKRVTAGVVIAGGGYVGAEATVGGPFESVVADGEPVTWTVNGIRQVMGAGYGPWSSLRLTANNPDGETGHSIAVLVEYEGGE